LLGLWKISPRFGFRPAGVREHRRKYGGQGQNGLAALALRVHFVRLSALRASVELPTRGFSVAGRIV